MHTTSTIIGLSAPVSIQAASGERRGPAKFTATIYTGGPLVIGGYDLPVVIDLAGLKTGNVLVANLDHEATKRVGNFEVENDGRTLTASGVASAATPWRDEVVNSAKDGYQWQASVEVVPGKLRTLKRGETANINGQTIPGPAYITTSGTLKGFAFVSHGADDNTTAAIAAQRRNFAMQELDFPQFMQQTFPALNMGDMTADQLATFHANYSGRHAANESDHAAVAPIIAASAPSDPVAIEQRRLRQIDAATEGDWENRSEQVADIKAKAINNEITVDELLAETRQIRADITRSKIPMATTIHHRTRDFQQPAVIEAALCQTIGLPVDKHFDEQTLEAAHKQYRGNLGLQQLLLMAAAENGYRLEPGSRISQGNLREVLQYAFPPIRASGFSTLSVSGLLSNIANKSLLTGWTEGDTTWRQVAQIKPASDFKPHTSYRMLDDMEYEEVGPGGEIKHGTLSDEHYTRQVATYAKMAAITRTQIINDDLGAFNDLRVRIGRGALTKFNDLFWQTFMDNGTFFSSGNNNLSQGTDTVLDAAGVGLQAAVLKFRQLKSPDGKSIDGEPVLLLAPPELEFNARRLHQSTNIVATGDTDASMVSANIFGGLYRPLVQNRLSNSSYTGYSDKAWYLLRDPRIAAVVCVSFLNGQESPTVETTDADFNTLGIQVRGYHDFGCDRTVDYLAGIMSTGVAQV